MWKRPKTKDSDKLRQNFARFTFEKWSVIEKASPTGTGKHVATLEMSSERQLVQARGVCNSTPAGSVKSALEIWARRGGIVSSPHLF